MACLPGGAPLCSECPLRGLCAARALGVQETLPVKGAARCKNERSIGPWRWCWIWKTGASCCSSARQKGLLAGLWQPVLLEGARSAIQTEQALAALGVTARAVEPLTPPGMCSAILCGRWTGLPAPRKAARLRRAASGPGARKWTECIHCRARSRHTVRC